MIIHLSYCDYVLHAVELHNDPAFVVTPESVPVTFITLEQSEIDQMGEGSLGEL